MTDTAPAPSRIAGSGLPAAPLAALDSAPVETRALPTSPTSAAEVRGSAWHLDDLWLPAVVLYEDALTHNLGRFRDWGAEYGVSLAPHGKTTMSPHLWSAQLADGAWGITAANAAQARVMRRYGVGRVLIANEVVDPAQISWLAGTLADPGFEPYCLVDSHAGVELMERHLEGAERPLPVLVELGVPGRRTGVRGVDEAVALARRVADSERLHLAGIEGYEGVLPQRRDAEATTTARDWLADLTTVVTRADSQGAFSDTEEVLVTAGGSGYPDLASAALTSLPTLSRPVHPVVRSGCYITHDDLSFERSSPLRSEAASDPLRPALSGFARVLSCPEPGLALLAVGKRDVPYDIDLPVPRALRRSGSRLPLDGRARVTELNDHHAFVSAETDLLQVGDTVELGLSHPCTTFDKWPLLPVLDHREQVVDAVRTLF